MNILRWLFSLFATSGQERPSPQDWVPAESLVAYAAPQEHSALVIPLTVLKTPLSKPPIVWMPHVPNTGSMEPVVDFGNNSIFIAGANKADHQLLVDALQVGDIAVYRFPADTNQPPTAFIHHRIVSIDKSSSITSKSGRIFRFRGDNNTARDSFIVRDENIKWISIGVIY